MDRLRTILSDPWHLWLAIWLLGIFACAGATWFTCKFLRINPPLPEGDDDDQAN